MTLSWWASPRRSVPSPPCPKPHQMEPELARTVRNVELVAGLHTPTSSAKLCECVMSYGYTAVSTDRIEKEPFTLEAATYLCVVCSSQRTHFQVPCCPSWAALRMEQM